MANAAAATCNSEQPAEALQRAEPKQHALPNGNASAEPASTAGAADDDVAGEGTRENGGLPTTQLEDSFVFLSDGGSSKEEDLYGDTSPDAGATAALQTSPGGPPHSFLCTSPDDAQDLAGQANTLGSSGLQVPAVLVAQEKLQHANLPWFCLLRPSSKYYTIKSWVSFCLSLKR